MPFAKGAKATPTYFRARSGALASQVASPYNHQQKEIIMTSYVESTLISDEKVIYTGKVSLWSMLPLFILGLLLLPFGVGLIFWLWAVIRYMTTELAFTNKRVIAKFGFISRKTIEMNLTKVESVQVNQGIIGRIFNFGTLIISGAGNPQAPIPGISSPMTFRRSFMEYQDKVRQG
jgi:membrane protein YdbS with pleckstrin-like domain